MRTKWHWSAEHVQIQKYKKLLFVLQMVFLKSDFNIPNKHNINSWIWIKKKQQPSELSM